MKTLLTILLLCSAAVSQQAAPAQSSEQTGHSIYFSPATAGSLTIRNAAGQIVTTKGDDGHWRLLDGRTIDDALDIMVEMQRSNQSELERQQKLTEQWLARYILALEFAHATAACVGDTLGHSGTRPASCRQLDSLTTKLQAPLPGETIRTKRKAGTNSEATRKPATEKAKP